MHLGTAFQLVDDLLDFTASDETLGKPAGADLLEGKLTLPLIYLLEKDSGKRASLQTVMRDGNYDEVGRHFLLQAVEESGALDQALQCAQTYAADAVRALDPLPASKYKEALTALPTYIIERDR
jgi:octaprenyl-diphosphate synthase